MSLPQNKSIDKWASKKLLALWAGRMMSEAADSIEDDAERAKMLKRAGRLSLCSHAIIIAYDRENDRAYVERAALCRDRLCPICSWRLAARRAFEMQNTISRILTENADIRGILLTLTVKNCKKDELGDTIRHLCQSYTRLRKHRAWQRYILGSARSIELSYNGTTETYHPHIHALLLVGPEYRANTITQGEYSEMWQTAARLDYRPVVDVRYTYSKEAVSDAEAYYCIDEVEKMRAGITEATKYALKPDALLAVLSDSELASIAQQLSGHRLISYGGIIKKARADLGYTDKDIPDDIIPFKPLGGSTLEHMAFEWSSKAGKWDFVGKLENNEDAENHLYQQFPHRSSRKK